MSDEYQSENLRKLLQRTGYQIIQSNGQRVYSFPNETQEPLKGSEIFVGKIPRNMFEDELVPFFERVGPIYDLRLMVDFNGKNRGYCFVRYRSRNDADMAVHRLNNSAIRGFKRIGVYKSIDNTRLFIGGIPSDKTQQDLWDALEGLMDNIHDIIMYASYENPARNRGFAFIEFDNHRSAAIARRRFRPGSLYLWDVPIKVDWADPLPDPDPKIMSRVLALYVRNLPMNMTAKEFKNFVYKIVNPSLLTKVHKTLDYAFLHFTKRSSAEQYLKLLNGLIVGGQLIDVQWARPDIYSKDNTRTSAPKHYCLSLPANFRRQVLRRKFDEKKGNSMNNSPVLSNSTSAEREGSISDYNSDQDFIDMGTNAFWGI